MKKIILPFTAFAALAAAMLPSAAVRANDSQAEFALGGLVLKQSEGISMDSEELFISTEQVRVKYRYTNTTDQDIKTLVSFPLPLLPESDDSYWMYEATPDFDALDFKTAIDGEEAPLTMEIRAMIGDRDVTGRVKELGWPINWLGEYDFIGQFDKMEESERGALVDAGLIRHIEDYDWEWIPAWQIARHVTRDQTFPAKRSIIVEHSYAPLVGGSAGTGLMGNLDTPSADQLHEEYRGKYCVDDSFLKGFQKRTKAAMAKDGETSSHYINEAWIGYVLSSGANWKGPIKDFRLVVDKGSPDNLISFCMDGVKKISPTQFEVRKTDFEPGENLDILLVEWHEIPE